MEEALPQLEYYKGIEIDLSRDTGFDVIGLDRLRDSYMRSDESSPQHRFAHVSAQFASNPEHAQRLYDYSSKFWFGYSTPILSHGRNNYGFAISCYLSFVEDSKKGLVDALSETNWLSMMGGGVGVYWNVRGQDEKSVGVIPHMKVYDDSSLAFKQGTCYHPNTEVLTNIGFVTFKQAAEQNLKVLQVNDQGQSTFVYPTEWVEQDFSGELIHFSNDDVDIRVTPNHRMFVKQPNNTFDVVTAENITPDTNIVFSTSVAHTIPDSNPYLSWTEQLHIALVSNIQDDNWSNISAITLSSTHKINKLKAILDNNNIDYEAIICPCDNIRFEINHPSVNNLDIISLTTLDTRKGISVLSELAFWNSIDTSDYLSFTFVSSNQQLINTIQAISTMSKIKCVVNQVVTIDSKIVYEVQFFGAIDFDCGNLGIDREGYVGKVYCAIVPFGGLVVRSNNKTLVCGNTRRGSYAMYLDISHPDIIEFLEMRKETGDPRRKCLNLHYGVNIPDSFMHLIEEVMKDEEFDDSWELRDPVSGRLHDTIKARDLWQKIIELRAGQGRGEPYIHFIDNSNKSVSPHLKKQGYKVRQSNLCLVGDTIIDIQDDDDQDSTSIRIDEFVNNFNAGLYKKVRIRSFNPKQQRVEWVRVDKAFISGTTTELVEIKTDNEIAEQQYVRCTPKHRIYTRTRKWVMAKKLATTDILIGQQIVSIEHKILPNEVPVYDLTVPLTQCFFANNIVVHNCSEIMLHTDNEKTAVCCLSSLNLDKWEEYKDNYQFFKDIMELLDNVLQHFIDNAPPEISRAVKSAVEERSVGLGVMGFHSYLQQQNIPFEGVMAKVANIRMFKQIKEWVDRANMELGEERGSPIMLEGTGLRFAHTIALAPTANNALICGNVSPGIEPLRANAYRQDTMSGTFIQKNKYLDKLIKQKEANGELQYDECWSKIVQDEGSIQGLSEFTNLEKDIFKTASELDMLWAVEHVTDRQPFVDQGQSFNIFIKPDISIKKLHAIHYLTWKKQGKSMYYVRTEKLANTEKVSQKIARVRIEDDIDLAAIVNDEDECLSCHS